MAQNQSHRESVLKLVHSRRERLAICHYFELSQRILKEQRQALEILEKHLEKPSEFLLKRALAQYEKSARLQKASVKVRLNLPVLACEKLSRAS